MSVVWFVFEYADPYYSYDPYESSSYNVKIYVKTLKYILKIFP